MMQRRLLYKLLTILDLYVILVYPLIIADNIVDASRSNYGHCYHPIRIRPPYLAMVGTFGIILS
jgi:hypothetical protein